MLMSRRRDSDRKRMKEKRKREGGKDPPLIGGGDVRMPARGLLEVSGEEGLYSKKKEGR